MTLRMLALAAMLGGLGGCAPDLAALATDKNALCVRVVTIWATTVIDRNFGCEMPAGK